MAAPNASVPHVSRDFSVPTVADPVVLSDGAPPAPVQPTEPTSKPAAELAVVGESDIRSPSHEGPSDRSVSKSPGHVSRSKSPANPISQVQSEDMTMTSVIDAPKAPVESAQHLASSRGPGSPLPLAYPDSSIRTTDILISAQPSAVQPHVTLPDVPLTMVQTSSQNQQGLSARQLGQRARRARERELQAQGLYVPKRRASTSATQPDPSSTVVSHAVPPSAHQGTLPIPTPPVQESSNGGDVTMQSADGDEDDDGEGELEADLTAQSVGPSILSAATPSVPPHSHLIPPIAVLAPAVTPSKASLAQRARRERERANRLGLTPGNPENHSGSPETPLSYVAPQHSPPAFNPAQVPPGSTHIATLSQIPQQPPTLSRGQLAQRARRARERVERAAKAQNSGGWNSATNTQDGVSSAGEAVFAVAPPPPSANGTPAGFATTATQHNPGYGIGLGANHAPQQLNRAQLAQRARRARERQQRVANAAANASSVPDPSRSPSSSIPPRSPTISQQIQQANPGSSPSPPTTRNPAPAQLSIGAQFAEVFKSLTAGDNGVSRAVADAGALTMKDDAKGRNRSHSPVERMTSPTQDGPDEGTDQLSEDSTRATTPSRDPGPTSPISHAKVLSPQLISKSNITTQGTPPPAATPDVRMIDVQSVGA